MKKQYEGERVDVLPTGQLKIIQSDDVFSFSLDAVLLAHFAYLPIRQGKVLDLCTGNGAVALMCSMRSQAHMIGIELQERLVDMARRSIQMNDLEDHIQIRQLDVRQAAEQLERGAYDVITCNPPYLPVTSGVTKQNVHQALARHEVACTLDDIIQAMRDLVRVKGRVAMVHRPSRLVDVLAKLRHYRLEPKRLRFVYPKMGKKANMFLVEAVHEGKPELMLEPPLIAYDANGTYSAEVRAIYHDAAMWEG